MQQSGPQEPRRPRRVGLLFGVAAAVFVADLITKIIVVATLTPYHEVKVIGTLLTLDLVRNSGAAFSFGPGITIVFTLIAVGVIFFIVRTSRRLYSMAWAVTLGLLLGGAAGQPHRPPAALARGVPRRGGGLGATAALAGLQRGRLVHRVRRVPRRGAGRPGDPAGRQQGRPGHQR